MKKLLYLFTASLLVFTSCSNDDDNSSDPASSILVKKITEYEDGLPVSRDFLYNGNKIISITEQDGSVYKYTYTGDLITKTEEIDADGKVDLTTDYSYANGKLVTSVEKNTDSKFYYKIKYTHNTDGTVSYDQFRGTVVTGVEEEYGTMGKYTFKNGNLIKLEVSYYGSESLSVYEYDAKNSPFKNITGVSLLLDAGTSVNNVVKEIFTSGSGANIYTHITTYTYKYDANNYPTEKVTTFLNGDSTSTETTLYTY